MRSWFIGLGFILLYVFAPLTLIWLLGEGLQKRAPALFCNTDQQSSLYGTWKAAGEGLVIILGIECMLAIMYLAMIGMKS